jgi:sporulation protein YlmC with PRC-barrel domain
MSADLSSDTYHGDMSADISYDDARVRSYDEGTSTYGDASSDRFYGASPKFDARSYGTTPQVQFQVSGPSVGGRTWSGYEASWLLGHEITTPQGGVLGWIDSFVVDTCSGRVALIVLDDVPKIGAHKLALPYNSVVRTGENLFVFNPGSMMIETAAMGVTNHDAAPGRDPYIYTLTMSSTRFHHGVPEHITPEWVASIYKHYGQQPFWTEGQMTMASSTTTYSMPPKASGSASMETTVCPPSASYSQTETFSQAQASCGFVLFDSEMFSKDLRTVRGDFTAHVSDLVIDHDGRVAFAIVSDIPGRTDLVAVPFHSLQASGDFFVLNIDGQLLAAAPAFGSRDLYSPEYASNVYRFYGLQPYWMEGEAGMWRY